MLNNTKDTFHSFYSILIQRKFDYFIISLSNLRSGTPKKTNRDMTTYLVSFQHRNKSQFVCGADGVCWSNCLNEYVESTRCACTQSRLRPPAIATFTCVCVSYFSCDIPIAVEYMSCPVGQYCRFVDMKICASGR